MKRIHIGMKVDDLDKAITFYSRLFDAKPTLQRPDYAKWMLDDPRVNFSINTHSDRKPGSAHYGIQRNAGGTRGDARTHRQRGAFAERSEQSDLWLPKAR